MPIGLAILQNMRATQTTSGRDADMELNSLERFALTYHCDERWENRKALETFEVVGDRLKAVSPSVFVVVSIVWSLFLSL